MLVLGVESSCDETAAAVVRDGRRVLSSVIASQHDLHAEYAGIVPEIASRAHAERLLPVVREALAQAGVGLGMIDAIAVGHRPGLIGSLLVGVAGAKALAWSLARPLVGVDHVHAHVFSPLLGPPHAPPPSLPALGLVVSGGHTSLFRVDAWNAIHRLGATIDDALGEAFDKAATMLGLPQPGGAALDALAGTPGANPAAADFPVARLSRDSLDFSFSGLKTALLYAVEGVPGAKGPPPPPLSPQRAADLAASFRRAAVDAILLKVRRAAERFPAPAPLTLLAGGGVTRNTLLRAELARLSDEGFDVRLPEPEYCTDNAAMIAGLAHELLAAGLHADLSLQAGPTPTP